MVGVTCVAVGVWLRWIVAVPGYTGPVPRMYISGMDTGIHAGDWFVLGVVALGVGNAVYLSGSRDRLAGAIRGGAGLLAVLLVVFRVIETVGVDGRVLRVYVLGPGAPVTASGSLLLVLAGGYQYLTAASDRSVEPGSGATPQ